MENLVDKFWYYKFGASLFSCSKGGLGVSKTKNYHTLLYYYHLQIRQCSQRKDAVLQQDWILMEHHC